MCLGMNPDILDPEERCASTSNRNFEGRQGALSRTHLMSPAMAAAAAIKGHFTDIREFDYATQDEPQIQIAHEIEDKNYKKLFMSTKRNTLKIPQKLKQKDLKTFQKMNLNLKRARTEIDNSAAGAPSIDNSFKVLTGITAPLYKANVDTDAIIPKQFLKTIKRTGLKDGLFYELRFVKGENGKDVETDFVLNTEPYRRQKFYW